MHCGLIILLLSVIPLANQRLSSFLPKFVKYEFFIVAMSFGMMMFASSYVEEEQQFWYWITTSHFIIAFLQRYIFLKSIDEVFNTKP